MQIITETTPTHTVHADMGDALRDDQPETSGNPYFTSAELAAMNRYCLRFRDLVCGGGTPTKQQEKNFMQYQDICYEEGAAHE